MTSSILFAKIAGGADAGQKLFSLSQALPLAHVTVLLDLLQPVCAVVLAVTLYRLVSTVDATLSLLAMMFRVGEGLLGFLPLLGKLELLTLAAKGAGPATIQPAYAALADEILHRPDDGFSAFCFVVGGFIFACLFLRGRLIPRWLAWIGVVTIGAQLIAVTLNIASLVPGWIVERMWMTILLYEVPLGIWLIIKGAREPLSAGSVPRTAMGL